MKATTGFEDLLRDLAPQVLGALIRRYGQFDAPEDAVQEALVAAAQRWPTRGVPDDPRAWLSTVASRIVAAIEEPIEVRRVADAPPEEYTS